MEPPSRKRDGSSKPDRRSPASEAWRDPRLDRSRPPTRAQRTPAPPPPRDQSGASAPNGTCSRGRPRPDRGRRPGNDSSSIDRPPRSPRTGPGLRTEADGRPAKPRRPPRRPARLPGATAPGSATPAAPPAPAAPARRPRQAIVGPARARNQRRTQSRRRAPSLRRSEQVALGVERLPLARITLDLIQVQEDGQSGVDRAAGGPLAAVLKIHRRPIAGHYQLVARLHESSGAEGDDVSLHRARLERRRR